MFWIEAGGWVVGGCSHTAGERFVRGSRRGGGQYG